MLKGLLHRAEVGCCGTCLDARRLNGEMLVDGAQRSTLEQLTDWMLQGERQLHHGRVNSRSRWRASSGSQLSRRRPLGDHPDHDATAGRGEAPCRDRAGLVCRHERESPDGALRLSVRRAARWSARQRSRRRAPGGGIKAHSRPLPRRRRARRRGRAKGSHLVRRGTKTSAEAPRCRK